MVQVKESFGIGKQDRTESSGTKDKCGPESTDGSKSAPGEDNQQKTEPSDSAETLFSKVKSGAASISPKVLIAFQKLKETKPVDLAKKGYGMVKDELSGNSSKRKRIEYEASSKASSPKVERSTSTDVVVVPVKQSRWSKKWEALKEKVI